MHSRITPRGGFVAIAALTLVATNVGLLASGASPGSRSRPKDFAGASPFALDDAPALEADNHNSTPAQPASSSPAPGSPKWAGESANSMPAGSFDTVEGGYRRVYRSETITLSPDQVRERLAEGKTAGLAGNQRILDTFTDHLPTDWLSMGEIPAGARVDSFGNPIVNSAAALPDWAQRDVDALRSDLAAWLLHRDNLDLALAGQAEQIADLPPRYALETYLRSEENLLADRFETESVIGNLLGQAIVRSINVADIPGAAIDQTLSDDVVGAIAAQLHSYENVKAHDAARFRREYTPTAHPAHVAALLESRGHSMQDVLSISSNGGGGENEGDGGIAGEEGGLGCYQQLGFGVGATLLSGATILWNGAVDDYDDESADVPIGFRHYFFPCSDDDENTSVRVSTNGYVSFFQQGGGALDGTDFTNDPLPSATDPDGIAAPWWDDLIVTNQGGADSVGYKVEGSVGNRVFTVQWSSISRLGGSTTDFHWFQVKLFESYTRVHAIYHTLWAPDTLDSASCGVENYTGSAAYCVFSCGNTNSAVPNINMNFFYPQASNDACAGAICIEEDESLVGNNFGASGTDISSCAFNDFADVWYRYRATASGNITVSLCDTAGTDTTVAVFNACGGAQVACNDDFCAGFGPSQVTFAGTAGTTYYIRVAGWDGTRGTFRVEVNGGGAGGEVCSTCWPLTATDTFTGSTTTNTGCDDDSSCAFNDIIDEWFCWTAPFDGTARVTTCSPTTNFDTTLAVYRGTCTSPIGLGCNDDAVLNGCELGPNFYKSRVLWNVQGGTAYKVRLAGYDGDAGVYSLSVSMWGCQADIAPNPAGDNVVDVDDLVAVILAWGPCNGCRADFAPPGGDGQVNVDDLVAVILNWGVCP